MKIIAHATLAALAITLAGCSSEPDSSANNSPTPTPSSTPTPSPSPFPSPSPSPTPSPVVYGVDGNSVVGSVDLTTGTFTPVGDLGNGFTDIAKSDVEGLLYVNDFVSIYTYDVRTTPPRRLRIGSSAFPSTVSNPNGLDYFDGKLVILSSSRAAFAIADAATGAISQTFSLASGLRGAGDIVAKSATEFWALLTNGSRAFITLISLPGPTETVNFELPAGISGFALTLDRSTGELVIPTDSGSILRFDPETETLRTDLTADQSGLPHLFGIAGEPLAVPSSP